MAKGASELKNSTKLRLPENQPLSDHRRPSPPSRNGGARPMVSRKTCSRGVTRPDRATSVSHKERNNCRCPAAQWGPDFLVARHRTVIRARFGHRGQSDSKNRRGNNTTITKRQVFFCGWVRRRRSSPRERLVFVVILRAGIKLKLNC